MAIHVVWFRNDLRVLDHEPLRNACQLANATTNDCVLPIFIVDPFWFAKTSFGFSRTGIHRKRFLKESLQDLDQQLSGLGGGLRACEGGTVDVFLDLIQQLPVESVSFHQEVASEERKMEQRVRELCSEQSVTIHASSPQTFCDWDTVPFSIEEVPEVFTKFRKILEKRAAFPPALPAPSHFRSVKENFSLERSLNALESLDSTKKQDGPNPTMRYQGGSTAGLERLNHYLWESDCLMNYKKTRNGMLLANDSSKFSPWIANGSISVRQIGDEVTRYESQRVKNDSTYWLKFELLWRDFFIFMTAKHGKKIFHKKGIKGTAIDWLDDPRLFEAWKEGETGFPLIDANMRELKLSGYMSNRGRQNVASFLTKNLGIDWRMGAEWFESQLLDYDPCLNYGNWNYAAGIGNDARGFRWFNTIKQSKDYDPNGDYLRHWLPELADLPNSLVHTPWNLPKDDQNTSGFLLGDSYPMPVVDLFESAELNQLRYEQSIGAGD